MSGPEARNEGRPVGMGTRHGAAGRRQGASDARRAATANASTTVSAASDAATVDAASTSTDAAPSAAEDVSSSETVSPAEATPEPRDDTESTSDRATEAEDHAGAEAVVPLTRQERLDATGNALAEAAAALLDDGPATATAEPLPEAEPAQEPLTFAEGCARLGVTPYVLRRLMDDYEDVLPPLVEAGNERRLPPAAVEVLARIAVWRGEGVGREEILRRVREGEATTATGEEDLGGQAVQRLVGELGRLHQELQRSEARRAEDRDRLLTVLMRSHQELQQLRYEMATAKSRKERRKGLWARLFG